MRLLTPAMLLALAAVGLLPTPAALATPPSLTVDSWVRDSAIVIHAKAISLEGARGRFRTLRCIKGSSPGPELSAGPLVTQSCVGPGDRPPFPSSTEVVLFLGSTGGDVYPVVGEGIAWLQLNEQRRPEVLAAVETVVHIESLASPEARMEGYLTAVEGENQFLRGVALRVITLELHGKDKAARWEDRLVPLIRSPVVDARLAAIQALKFSQSEKALPGLLDALGDENKSIREWSSMALAPYDTESTVKALIDAAKRSDMVQRVIIDLRGSRRPEARQFLVGYLKSEDPKLREMAARSFYRAVCDGDPVIFELHRLTKDPNDEVRLSAVEALHKSPLPETVNVLLETLRRPDLGLLEHHRALGSLSVISGTIRHRDGIAKAFRDAPDLAPLMEKSLRAPMIRNLPPMGGNAITILAKAATPEAVILLRRVMNGEFGAELAETAAKTLEHMATK